MSAQSVKRPPARRRDVLDLVNVLARAGWGPGLSRPAFRAPRIILTALANKAYDAHLGRAGGDPNTCMSCIDGARSDWDHYQLRRYGTTKPALHLVPTTDSTDDETAFSAYMKATYPEAAPHQWARLALKDPHAKELARASA